MSSLSKYNGRDCWRLQGYGLDRKRITVYFKASKKNANTFKNKVDALEAP